MRLIFEERLNNIKKSKEMKRLTLVIAAMILTHVGFAQQDTLKVEEDNEIKIIETQDTTKIKIGKMVFIITEEGDSSEVNVSKKDSITNIESKREQTKRLTHWNGIDIGMNTFSFGSSFDIDAGKDNFLEVDLAKSRSISFNMFEEKLRIFGDYFGVFTGLGFEINSYALRNDYTLQMNDGMVTAFKDSTITLRKNKLRTTWVNVPLMFEFNTSTVTDKNVHLSAGVIGGWRLGTKYKQKYKMDGEKFKVKSNKSLHMMDYKMDASVRLGFRSFTLFANYGLTPLFEEGKAAEIHPITLGIQIIGF